MPDDIDNTMTSTPPSEDDINLPDEVKNTEDVQAVEDARRKAIQDKTEDLISSLQPVITSQQAEDMRTLAGNGEVSDVISYLQTNVPEVGIYLGGTKTRLTTATMGALGSEPSDLSDDDQISIIKKGLKARAESMVPNYSTPPFLGNEVQEARGKEEDTAGRYAAQYAQVPEVAPVFRGRSAVDNPYYNPPIPPRSIFRSLVRRRIRKGKVTRLKFL